ncbi:permease prefix domain 1-containing protein [Alkalihalobacillus pseudalcaliphilus]|uniref:permease prefix domain 1-containing protein n=1 Tax=Alkalihalobacillus pseudalcaliphilus TaxID=79884 RepID=UPI00064DC14D|nr:permease prefix domain 1-containing protein [Alkalihalobacillus pseudalcaliphilus]KMK77521.1 hypothetical protein AB990_03370 [Alkalihalobacillus pseudalcaliphilus]
MNTIINYLDNMFSSLPKSQQITQLKEELLANMEEKYYELKSAGKSENEAIGVVISEFGNIDEIIEEFDLGLNQSNHEALPLLNDDDVYTYIEDTRVFQKMIGIGVFLCIIGSALLTLILQLPLVLSDGTKLTIGLTILLVFVAIAVGIFIYSGMKMKEYDFINEGQFELSTQAKRVLEKGRAAFQPTFVSMIIIGVALCILSPLALILELTLFSNKPVYGIALLLAMVATAVFIFVYFGGLYGSYNKLLDQVIYTEREQKSDQFIGSIAAIIWPLAVIIFLLSGFVFGQWHINWIIFPVTGLLFAIVSAVVAMVSDNKKGKWDSR